MPASFPGPHWMGGRETLGTGYQAAMPEPFHSRGQHLGKCLGKKESVYIRKEFSTGLVWNTNMAAMTSCENAIYLLQTVNWFSITPWANVVFFLTFIVCANVFLNLSLCTNVARRKKWRRVNHWMTFLPHFDAFCDLFFFKYQKRKKKRKRNTFQVDAWLFPNVSEILAFFTSKKHFLVRLLFFFLLFKNYCWILASPLLTNLNIW